jgi:hypothetical protein
MNDLFCWNETYLDLGYFNRTEDHASMKRDDKRIWNHYKIFDDVADIIYKECNFISSSEPYAELVVKDYPNLWKDHRWGSNRYLRFYGSRYPHGFEFEFYYQDSRTGNRNGGAYDIDKGHYAKPLERYTFKIITRKIVDYMKNIGVEVRSPMPDSIDRAFVMWSINEDPGRHWGRYETYKDTPYFKSVNAQDRDYKIIENGQIKYFRDQHGHLARGEVYHNINNMWWVVLNDAKARNIGSYELFDPKPEDFIYRRVIDDRATEQQKVRRKIGTRRYNDLVSEGIVFTLSKEDSRD